MTYRTSPAKRMMGRLQGGLPVAQLDTHTLYLLRVAGGGFFPGRILDLGHLWESSYSHLFPRPSAETTPREGQSIKVGLLAATNIHIDPDPRDLDHLLALTPPAFAEEPTEAFRELDVWWRELRDTDLDFALPHPTVIDPHHVRPLPHHHAKG